MKPLGGQIGTDIRAIYLPNHVERFSNWFRGGHNNKRITRIIRSLRVLGRHDLATIMLHAVESIWDLPEYIHHHKDETSTWWASAFLWPLCKCMSYKSELETDDNSDSPPQGTKGEVAPGLEWLKDVLDAK